MYRTYSYNDMPVPVSRNNDEKMTQTVSKEKNCEKTPCKDKKNTGILGGVSNDDLILIAIVIALIADGCDDKLLIVVLVFVFLSDLF